MGYGVMDTGYWVRGNGIRGSKIRGSGIRGSGLRGNGHHRDLGLEIMISEGKQIKEVSDHTIYAHNYHNYNIKMYLH